MNKYYKVVVTRGHMGKGYNHATMTFYECAKNMMEAMDKARQHGGVKHNRIPMNAMEITKEEFDANFGSNAYDRAGCRKDKGISYFKKICRFMGMRG